MSTFSDREYLRYTRHIQLPKLGAEGQTKLRNAHALIVGCGGLGAPVSLYLAAAGIGTITLVDGDTVELTNLQRQVTFGEQDIGKNKAASTRQRLCALNSDIDITAIESHLNNENASTLIKNADIVLDCTDNFEARHLINTQCKTLGRPWVYASIFQFSGQCAVFNPNGACFKCLFPENDIEAPDCNTAGVLGVLPGILGTIQATEAIKYLLDIEGSLANQLLLVEVQSMTMQKIALTQSKTCPICNGEQTALAASSSTTTCTTVSNEALKTVSTSDFLAGQIRKNTVLLDVRSQAEHTAFNLADRGYSHLHIPDEAFFTTGHAAQSFHNADANRSTHTNDLALDKQLDYLVYCQSGQRSSRVCEIMQKNGFEVFNLDGGLQALLKALH